MIKTPLVKLYHLTYFGNEKGGRDQEGIAPLLYMGKNVGEQFLTRFTYTYNISGGDKGTIVLSFPFTNLDLSVLTRGTFLKIQWGYMGQPLNEGREVAIEDIKLRHNAQGVVLTLDLISIAEFLDKNPAWASTVGDVLKEKGIRLIYTYNNPQDRSRQTITIDPDEGRVVTTGISKDRSQKYTPHKTLEEWYQENLLKGVNLFNEMFMVGANGWIVLNPKVIADLHGFNLEYYRQQLYEIIVQWLMTFSAGGVLAQRDRSMEAVEIPLHEPPVIHFSMIPRKGVRGVISLTVEQPSKPFEVETSATLSMDSFDKRSYLGEIRVGEDIEPSESSSQKELAKKPVSENILIQEFHIRIVRGPSDEYQTIGDAYVYDATGEQVYDFKTLELPWRDNKKWVSSIPFGTYKAKKRNSAKFGDHFHILGVPDRKWILIHWGNYNRDTNGCILPGATVEDIDGDGIVDVTSSRSVMNQLNSLLPSTFTVVIGDSTSPITPQYAKPKELPKQVGDFFWQDKVVENVTGVVPVMEYQGNLYFMTQEETLIRFTDSQVQGFRYYQELQKTFGSRAFDEKGQIRPEYVDGTKLAWYKAKVSWERYLKMGLHSTIPKPSYDDPSVTIDAGYKFPLDNFLDIVDFRIEVKGLAGVTQTRNELLFEFYKSMGCKVTAEGDSSIEVGYNFSLTDCANYLDGVYMAVSVEHQIVSGSFTIALTGARIPESIHVEESLSELIPNVEEIYKEKIIQSHAIALEIMAGVAKSDLHGPEGLGKASVIPFGFGSGAYDPYNQGHIDDKHAEHLFQEGTVLGDEKSSKYFEQAAVEAAQDKPLGDKNPIVLSAIDIGTGPPANTKVNQALEGSLNEE